MSLVSSSCVCDPGSGFSLFYKTIDLITLGFVALKRTVKIRTPIVGDNLKKMLDICANVLEKSEKIMMLCSDLVF